LQNITNLPLAAATTAAFFGLTALWWATFITVPHIRVIPPRKNINHIYYIARNNILLNPFITIGNSFITLIE